MRQGPEEPTRVECLGWHTIFRKDDDLPNGRRECNGGDQAILELGHGRARDQKFLHRFEAGVAFLYCHKGDLVLIVSGSRACSWRGPKQVTGDGGPPDRAASKPCPIHSRPPATDERHSRERMGASARRRRVGSATVSVQRSR